ncbi:hypothetical protein GGR57DRAFT_144514 [Xylariaceae sp. FL1272]|nr:hypothetical protein GGR57DRAFT_144514 [Xylariaceae sp. FL1272]
MTSRVGWIWIVGLLLLSAHRLWVRHGEGEMVSEQASQVVVRHDLIKRRDRHSIIVASLPADEVPSRSASTPSSLSSPLSSPLSAVLNYHPLDRRQLGRLATA